MKWQKRKGGGKQEEDRQGQKVRCNIRKGKVERKHKEWQVNELSTKGGRMRTSEVGAVPLKP